MAPAHLVVFDFDGTLSDGRACVLRAMRQAFAEHGQPRPADEAVLSTVGLKPVDAVRHLLSGCGAGAPEAIAGRYRDLVTSLLRDQPDLERPFPGAAQCLDRLASHCIRLAIATGKTLPDLERSLARYGWGHHFASLHSSDQGPGKPHPGLLLDALTASEVPPTQAVMVGDTAFDIEMARRAGVASIAVAWGYHDRVRLEAAAPDRIVESYDQLYGTVADCLAR